MSEMAGDAGRVRKELAECARDSESGVTATPKGDSLSCLEGTILGPEVRDGGVLARQIISSSKGGDSPLFFRRATLLLALLVRLAAVISSRKGGDSLCS